MVVSNVYDILRMRSNSSSGELKNQERDFIDLSTPEGGNKIIIIITMIIITIITIIITAIVVIVVMIIIFHQLIDQSIGRMIMMYATAS